MVLKFHEILRQLIEENDMTQKKLAMDLNIAPSTVGSYVQGVREPDFSILVRIAAYFHVSTDYLLGVPAEQTADSLDRELLYVFHQLNGAQKELFLEQGKAFIKVLGNISKNSSEKIL